MIELKQELEALADQWHNYIGGGTMTNKEHAKQLRKIIAKFDQQQQKEAIEKVKVAFFRALESGVSGESLAESMRDVATTYKTLPLLATARHRINLTT
jgi:glutamine amidotransferase-like uncharacterized protein